MMKERTKENLSMLATLALCMFFTLLLYFYA